MADGGTRDGFITLMVALIALVSNLARPVVDFWLDRRKAKRDRRTTERRHDHRRKDN